MDEICKTPEGFELLVQQRFLRDYITKNTSWRSLLLYHQIGSGKTCTAITLAEKYMDMFPDKKVTVILPARLKTNFLDELISPCGMDRYISADEFSRYHDTATTAKAQGVIRRKFMSAISQRYTIMTFEGFRSAAQKSKDLRVWVENFTKDRMIIVDEVHNLLSSTYNKEEYKKMLQAHKLGKAKGSITMLFKYLNAFAHASCKMLYMTATPVFDNIAQFRLLIEIMNPGSPDIAATATIKQVIDKLRGRVSYFPGVSENAYPSLKYVEEKVVISHTQDNVMLDLQIAEDIPGSADESSEAFKIKQRMAGIACLPHNAKITPAHFDEILNDIDEYAPKVKALVNNITKLRGKHVVYSTFIAHGLDIVEAAMRRKGWVSWKDVSDNADLQKTKRGKVYAVWDGRTTDADKLTLKAIVNSKENMTGSHIRVVLGSPSIKEGVSFKHIQHLHLLDPVWNSSAKHQVEGRASRYCSHVDIRNTHTWLKRQVVVHLYKAVVIPGGYGTIDRTADELIYDVIIPHKQKLIEAAEKALQIVAIDYHLFKQMYNTKRSPRTPDNIEDLSPVSLDEENDIPLRNIRSSNGSCPRKNKPVNGRCPPEMPLMKKTPKGDDCCYRNPRVPVTNKTCPKPRRPVILSDGSMECPPGQTVKVNKHGDSCCYKR